MALCANLLAKVAILLSPAMPKTCAKIADTLGFSIDTASYETLVLKNEISNFTAKATEPLFPRIEKELMGEASKPKEEPKVEASVPSVSSAQSEPGPKVAQISPKSREISDEEIFLANLAERIEVLFEGLKQTSEQDLSQRLELTTKFLEFTLANIENRLQNLSK